MRSGLGVLATAGMLLFSGFTFSLKAEDAAVLVAPREIFSGGSSALTLTTFNAQTRRPVSRRAIVRLLDGNRIVAGLFDGPTGADGRVHVSFEVPDIPGGNYRFEAQVSRVETALDGLAGLVDRLVGLDQDSRRLRHHRVKLEGR
ncbi:MAG: hypothetical protein VX288_08265, partial [Planctomycetota bacterium]|nr:hypothetical protein [Planctomycetota bacterium]